MWTNAAIALTVAFMLGYAIGRGKRVVKTKPTRATSERRKALWPDTPSMN